MESVGCVGLDDVECDDEQCIDQLAARLDMLEQTVDEIHDTLSMATHRDIPLLKGTVRALIDGEIDQLEDLPDAGRTFNRRVGEHSERLDTVENELATLEAIQSENQPKRRSSLPYLRSHGTNGTKPTK